jgi:hypothetical protein
LTFSKHLFIIFIMKIGKIILLSVFLVLAGCGGGLNTSSSGGQQNNPSGGYQVELSELFWWDSSSCTLTFFYSCIPYQNISMRGEFTGPTSGQFTPTLNPSTNIWVANVILQQDGTYEIKVYATDSSGKETLILTFQYTTPSSGSGGGGSGGGGGGDDTPPPPPF